MDENDKALADEILRRYAEGMNTVTSYEVEKILPAYNKDRTKEMKIVITIKYTREL